MVKGEGLINHLTFVQSIYRIPCNFAVRSYSHSPLVFSLIFDFVKYKLTCINSQCTMHSSQLASQIRNKLCKERSLTVPFVLIKTNAEYLGFPPTKDDIANKFAFRLPLQYVVRQCKKHKLLPTQERLLELWA